MSYEIPGFQRSYETTTDLSALQYTFVKMSGSNVAATSAVTDKVIGVLQNKPNGAAPSGANPIAATVMISGVTRVIASKAIAAGVPVYLAAGGQVSDTSASSNVAIGISEEAAAGANSVFAILLKPLGAVA